MKITSILTAVGGLALLSSCGNGKSMGESEANLDKNFYADTVEWSDSVVVRDNSSIVSVIAVSPTMKNHATDSINAWIAECLMPKERPTGSITDIVKRTGEAAIDSIKSDFDRMKASGYDTPMPEEYQWNIGPEYVAPKYVTYKSVSYSFLGGAHGSTIHANATFELPTGKMWGYNMLRTSDLVAVKDLVIDGLQSYFDVDSVEALNEKLLVGVTELTLPQTAPCLTENGMEFVYQQYEIAPYAAGMPRCVIPYSKIEKYMVPDAQALIK